MIRSVIYAPFLAQVSLHKAFSPPTQKNLLKRTRYSPIICSDPLATHYPLCASSWLCFFFFFTLVTGPRRSLSLQLRDTRVYEPQTRARLGTTVHFCKVVVHPVLASTKFLSPLRCAQVILISSLSSEMASLGNQTLPSVATQEEASYDKMTAYRL